MQYVMIGVLLSVTVLNQGFMMIATISDIDFNELYKRHKQRAGRPAKPASAWDARAHSLRGKPLESAYTDAFIERMDFSGARTVLDVGCGAGNIGVQIAHRLEAVYGMDYSSGMLDVMARNAAARGLKNVHPIQAGWDDDWEAIPVCDIVVASRSTLVEDMGNALLKLHNHARQRVYLSYLTGGFFVDPAIARLLGRDGRAHPDYMYILNILHSMDVTPRLDYIDLPGPLAGTENFDDFAEKVTRTLGELNDAEHNALQHWYDADADRARRGGAPMRWAFISWETNSYD